mmetsp:Transcript_17864/g.23542  ORF Transcript_17864/g.23542 Transcript_17864/m.23542 type:complete len:318 (+) Transcript_17864:217-1170(+)
MAHKYTDGAWNFHFDHVHSHDDIDGEDRSDSKFKLHKNELVRTFSARFGDFEPKTSDKKQGCDKKNRIPSFRTSSFREVLQSGNASFRQTTVHAYHTLQTRKFSMKKVYIPANFADKKQEAPSFWETIDALNPPWKHQQDAPHEGKAVAHDRVVNLQEYATFLEHLHRIGVPIWLWTNLDHSTPTKSKFVLYRYQWNLYLQREGPIAEVELATKGFKWMKFKRVICVRDLQLEEIKDIQRETMYLSWELSAHGDVISVTSGNGSKYAIQLLEDCAWSTSVFEAFLKHFWHDVKANSTSLGKYGPQGFLRWSDHEEGL